MAYDWRVRFGLSLDEVTERRMSWGEAWDLTSEILRDPYSHTLAAVQGWAYVPGEMQRVMSDVLEVYLNTKRGKNQRPVKVPRPWMTKPPDEVRAPAPVDGERARRRAALEAHLT